MHARDVEADHAGHVALGRANRDSVDRLERADAALAEGGIAGNQPVEADIVAEPLEAPVEGRDRRTVGLAHLETRRTRRRNDVPGGVEGAVSQVAGSEVAEPVVSEEHESGAVRTAEPLLAGLAVGIDAKRMEVDRYLSGALGSVDDRKNSSFPGKFGNLGERHYRTGGPLHVGNRDDSGPRRDRSRNRAEDIAAAIPDVYGAHGDAEPVRDASDRGKETDVFEVRGDDLIAGTP